MSQKPLRVVNFEAKITGKKKNVSHITGSKRKIDSFWRVEVLLA